jgi:hypothetical protein
MRSQTRTFFLCFGLFLHLHLPFSHSPFAISVAASSVESHLDPFADDISGSTVALEAVWAVGHRRREPVAEKIQGLSLDTRWTPHRTLN